METRRPPWCAPRLGIRLRILAGHLRRFRLAGELPDRERTRLTTEILADQPDASEEEIVRRLAPHRLGIRALKTAFADPPRLGR